MNSICLVGNYAPRCCGIATFTQDLRTSLLLACPDYQTNVAVAQGTDDENSFPPEVCYLIGSKNRQAYSETARLINEAGPRAVCLQHEFGIYGGDDGGWIVDLLRHLTAPVITTCHTVLRDPSINQREIIQSIARYSGKLVVMAEKGAEFLRNIYDIPDHKIEVIAHGIPDLAVTAEESRQLRREMGWNDRPVLLTFGLLSPNKGVEHAISALPDIVRQHPDVLYVIAGATHPNLVKQAGESYRESLVQLAASLGVSGNIAFVNHFIPEKELVSLIAAADVYLTPYLSETQITSGTLAFAFGLGKPVISTPYWYAQELLSDGAGVLVPFADSAAIADAVSSLLTDHGMRNRMAAMALQRGGEMRWSCVGRKYAGLLLKAAPIPRVEVLPVQEILPGVALPVSFHQLKQMTGDFGIYQHGLLNRPDPRHGFCADDNARVVVLLSGLKGLEQSPDGRALKTLMDRCVRFLGEAWNPERQRFRNFMDVEGRWLEPVGSEDSHGRVLWALGVHLACLPPHERSETLTGIFLSGVHSVLKFTSPRAWAFTLLGIAHFAATGLSRPVLRGVQQELSDRLVRLYRSYAGIRWHWFENIVTYDNAKLPEALMMSYEQLDNSEYLDTALSSLEFLVTEQTAPRGYFRPVGCRGFWPRGAFPARFDQQPLEAQAMTAACLRAAAVTRTPHWIGAAECAYDWFTGGNEHGAFMALPLVGGCYDGLMENGVNENQGAESILAYLQATFDIGKCMAKPLLRMSGGREPAVTAFPPRPQDRILSA